MNDQPHGGYQQQGVYEDRLEARERRDEVSLCSLPFPSSRSLLLDPREFRTRSRGWATAWCHQLLCGEAERGSVVCLPLSWVGPSRNLSSRLETGCDVAFFYIYSRAREEGVDMPARRQPSGHGQTWERRQTQRDKRRGSTRRIMIASQPSELSPLFRVVMPFYRPCGQVRGPQRPR